MKSVTLGELATFTNGGTPARNTPAFFDGDIPWITGADIDLQGRTSARSFITSEAVRKSATNLVPAGTVLLVTRTSIGKVGVSREPLCFSQDITAIQPDKARLDRDYLVHFLRANEHHFASRARGATIKGVTREAVTSLEVPLPPVGEQRRIGAILDEADALRAKRREALALLDDLTESIFIQAVTSPAADAWPVVTVADVAGQEKGSIRTGPFGSQLLHSEFVEEGVAVLGIDNAVNNEFRWADRRFITTEKYRSLRRYTVHPGDVLVTIMGTCGRCAVVPEDVPLAINTKHLCCISVDRARCLPEFLHASFLWQPVSRSALARATKGAIMDGLNMGLIKAMPLRLPPMDVQVELVQKIKSVGENRAVHTRSVTELNQLFISLQARAFAGRL
ncbi:type I restriction enzyme S subunit [Terracoccus luteus]|uniref:Type I restriction enzyme S subunit n=1 Tax=Terracoccus luteus TaxID=53356 RepID=A0A495Y3A1_9MICO|nr:restriction endonuclease subunit S [Terracoccus luteus]RKT78668.1 type I restriction enzyme S subunit [Terracoccus luteus]